jgi:hypothetical protein
MDITIGYIKTGSIKIINPFSEEEWKAMNPGARQDWAEKILDDTSDAILLEGFNDFSKEDGGGFDSVPDISSVYGITEPSDDSGGVILENRTAVYEAYIAHLPALGEEYIL